MTQKPAVSQPEAAMVDPAGIDDRYFLFTMLSTLANRMQAFGDTVFEELTWKQWFALLGTSVFQSAPSVSQVAGFVGPSRQNMKQLLLRLQDAGLIRLENDAADQRRTLVRQTPAAMEFELRYRERSAGLMEDFFSGIAAEDLAAARRVLAQLDGNLRMMAERKKP